MLKFGKAERRRAAGAARPGHEPWIKDV